MNKITTTIVFLMSSAASADIRADADALIEQSFHEHRVLFNCSEQTPDLMNLFVDWMPRAIEDAIPQLTAIGYTPEEIGALLAEANFQNMLLPDDATLAELRALCALDPDWSRKFKFMEIVLLRDDLQELIDAQ